MLKRLSIKNFRSIVDAELDFGRLNLFIGPNGSGKSNVLEAMGVVSAMLGRGISPQDLAERGVRVSAPVWMISSFVNPGPASEMSIGVEMDSIKYQCKFTGDIDNDDFFSMLDVVVSEEILRVDDRVIMLRPPGYDKDAKLDEILRMVIPEKQRSAFDSLRQFIPWSQSEKAQIEDVVRFAIYSPHIEILRGNVDDRRPRQYNTPVRLAGGNLADALIQIKHPDGGRTDEDEWFSDDDIPGMSLIIGRYKPFVVAGGGDIGFRDESVAHDLFINTETVNDGALHNLFIATIFSHPRTPPIFSIDNVDETLNPGMVRRVMAYIRDRVEADSRRQVFLTSHNPMALDEMDPFDDDHRIFVVYRDKETGHTKFHRLQPAPGMTRQQWQRKWGNLSAMLVDGLIPHALDDFPDDEADDEGEGDE